MTLAGAVLASEAGGPPAFLTPVVVLLVAAVLWVVYLMPVSDGAVRAVCEQREWERLEAARPGCYTLVTGGIASEGEGERLARGTSGDAKPRHIIPSAKEAAA